MNEPTEARWVDHCDEGCGLGTFKYDCPVCGLGTTDYEIWFLFDDVLGGLRYKFPCERCQAPLVVYYERDEGTVVARDCNEAVPKLSVS